MNPQTLDGIIRIIEIIATGVVTVLVARNTLKMNSVKNKVEVVEKKLDENSIKINGHMTALLETTKELATAKGKEIGMQEEKNKQ